MRPMIQAPGIADKIKSNSPKTDDEVLDLEYSNVFEAKTSANFDEEGESRYYKIMIFNNTEVQSGMFFSTRSKCEFCDKEHKESCDF